MRIDHLPNLSSLLELYDLEALKSLIRKYPNAELVLKAGRVQGGRAPEKSPLTPREATDLARKTLSVLVERTEPTLAKLKLRLHLVSYLGLTGDLVALVGSSSVVALAVQLTDAPSNSAKLASATLIAAISLVGAALSVWTRWLRRDVTGETDALVKCYLTLRSATWESQQLLEKLTIFNNRTDEELASQEILTVVLRAETVSEILHQQMQIAG